MLTNQIKESLRKGFLDKRKSLSFARREQASQLAFTFLKQWVEDFSPRKSTAVLSFAPFGDEIDIWSFNRWILKERRLILPRIEQDEFLLYQVSSLQDLEQASFGILEPVQKKSGDPLNPKEVEVAIIPGLAFDNQMHRLGYGKGHYDKLLPQLSGEVPKLGIGFKEQLTQEALPTHPLDISLTHRFLF